MAELTALVLKAPITIEVLSAPLPEILVPPKAAARLRHAIGAVHRLTSLLTHEMARAEPLPAEAVQAMQLLVVQLGLAASALGREELIVDGR
jgi:hypothetical protein